MYVGGIRKSTSENDKNEFPIDDSGSVFIRDTQFQTIHCQVPKYIVSDYRLNCYVIGSKSFHASTTTFSSFDSNMKNLDMNLF
eukprot:snap_masked-scaffold_26-processed-gene-0.22-mRNA-1 protein AED:1.00 eAED:1.00 QI:0/-1/0/0/-1/1/1/0/82